MSDRYNIYDNINVAWGDRGGVANWYGYKFVDAVQVYQAPWYFTGSSFQIILFRLHGNIDVA